MQMYRVKFALPLAENMVDLGDVLVCAASNELAQDLVCQVLEIRRSDAQFDVARIKPSLYQLGRKEAKNSLATADALLVDANLASSATFPGVTENKPDEFWWNVVAQANIRAEHETLAILKMATALQREMRGEQQKGSLRDLDIKCDRMEYHPRPPAIEKNALYAVTRILQGGATRSR